MFRIKTYYVLAFIIFLGCAGLWITFEPQLVTTTKPPVDATPKTLPAPEPIIILLEPLAPPPVVIAPTEPKVLETPKIAPVKQPQHRPKYRRYRFFRRFR